MYGSGVYFSDSPSKADQYIPARGLLFASRCCMFLARVCLGHAFVTSLPGGHPKLRRPPCIQGHSTEPCEHTRHDSVFANVAHRFHELVVYDRSQCYPEFLIEYERQL